MDLPLDSIICGDNCDVLGTFPRNCIDLVVTSPPYDDLRIYGGHEWDFYGVAWQLKRVLKPGGVIVWVVADQTKDGSETGNSWRQAHHFQTIGLRIHDTMIYETDKPPMNDRRYQASWEYMFVFSKGRPKTFNAIRVPAIQVGTVQRGTFRQKSGEVKDIWKAAATGDTKVRECIWYYASGPNGTDHPASYPLRLARDHILSWSNEGDIVLDPFNGSGTTTKMAREMGRRYIGIDINDEYCDIARKRLEQKLLFGPPS